LQEIEVHIPAGNDDAYASDSGGQLSEQNRSCGDRSAWFHQIFIRSSMNRTVARISSSRHQIICSTLR
jgi:hypothetical protein